MASRGKVDPIMGNRVLKNQMWRQQIPGVLTTMESHHGKNVPKKDRPQKECLAAVQCEEEPNILRGYVLSDRKNRPLY